MDSEKCHKINEKLPLENIEKHRFFDIFEKKN